jgi:putative tryptophan/tyrosine transport system substrate-binding protein
MLFGHLKRREVIALLGGAAAWPVSGLAQQTTMPVIGFLNASSPDGHVERLRGFRQGLKDEGFGEGENVSVEYRWAENQINRVSAMATELVRRRVSVIVATGGNAAPAAAKAATTTVPILFVTPDDPVALGYVTSLARPGGNLTGINFLGSELGAKRLELLRDLVRATNRVAVLYNPAGPASESRLSEVQAAARTMGLQIQVFNAGTSREIDAVFATFGRERPDTLFVPPDPFFRSRRMQLTHLATLHKVAATYSLRTLPKPVG